MFKIIATILLLFLCVSQACGVILVQRSASTTEYTKYATENTADFNSITYASGSCLTGVEDTALEESTPTTSNGSATTIAIHEYAAANRGRTLIKFDLSTIPSTATVTSVELGVYGASGGTQTFSIVQVVRSWVEGEATWNISETGTNWGTSGALNTTSDIASSSVDSSISMTASTWSTSTVTALKGLVQDWIDGTEDNYGVLLHGGAAWASNAVYSGEGNNGYRPYLKIVYED